jgi:hypothetical protein
LTHEVRSELAALYSSFSLSEIKREFSRRTMDDRFIQIAELALDGAMTAKVPKTQAGFVWLGFEIAIDSRFLPEVFR